MRSDNELDRGFAALRTEESPTGAHQRALQKLQPPTPSRNWRVAALPLVAAGVAAAFLSMPRTSSAAELKKMLDALRQTRVWMVTTYVTDKNGNKVVSQRIASNGRVHKSTFNPDAPGRSNGSEKAVAFVDGARINFFPDCTLIETAENQSEGPEQIVSNMISGELVTDVKVQNKVTEGGRLVDRYTFTWNQVATGGRHGEIMILTEPGTRKPVRIVGLSGNSVGFESEWTYSNIPPDLLNVDIPQDKPSYDLRAQRRHFEANVKGLQPRPGLVQVIGVWADRAGYLVVMTTGEVGVSTNTSATLSLNGQIGKATSMPWGKTEGEWQLPVDAFGKSVVAHVAKFDGEIPDRGTIVFPYWKKGLGVDPLMQRYEGPIHVTKTFSVHSLFTPMNAPYFESVSRASSPTTKG